MKKVLCFLVMIVVAMIGVHGVQQQPNIASLKVDDIYHIDTDVLIERLKGIGIDTESYLEVITNVSSEELEKKLSRENPPLVVNVLTSNYYDDCHIAGSYNVTLKEFLQTVVLWDRNKEIVVYCANDECDASEKGSLLLCCLGFTHVFEFQGGIKEWFEKGHATSGPCICDYLREESSGENAQKSLVFDYDS